MPKPRLRGILKQLNKASKRQQLAVTINVDGSVCKLSLDDKSVSPDETNKARVALNNMKLAVTADDLIFRRLKPSIGNNHNRYDLITCSNSIDAAENRPATLLFSKHMHDHDEAGPLRGVVMLAYNLTR